MLLRTSTISQAWILSSQERKKCFDLLTTSYEQIQKYVQTAPLLPEPLKLEDLFVPDRQSPKSLTSFQKMHDGSEINKSVCIAKFEQQCAITIINIFESKPKSRWLHEKIFYYYMPVLF